MRPRPGQRLLSSAAPRGKASTRPSSLGRCCCSVGRPRCWAGAPRRGQGHLACRSRGGRGQ
eukprot:4252939-Alexandrium_andersonii.AAC.1